MKEAVETMPNKELLSALLEVDKEIVGNIDLREIIQAPTILYSHLSEGKQMQLLAAGELIKRLIAEMAYDEPQIDDLDVLAKQLMSMYRYDAQEHLIVISLNSNRQPLVCSEIGKGTMDKAVVTPREIFREAIKYSASYVILVHNHPCGDPEPSKPDIDQTIQTCNVGKILNIPVIDHIVLGDNKYVSMSETGIINFDEYLPE